LAGMRAFRRLLLALHQDSDDVMDVFGQWQEWRTWNGLNFSPGERTAYYAQGSFASEFLRFVRLHYIPAVSKAPLAITALVEYEAALLGSGHESDDRQASDDIEELISRDSRPRLLPGVSVIKVPADYREIVRRLQERSPLDDIQDQPVKLAIRRTAAGPLEVRQLSPLSAEPIRLCERGLTVEQMAAEFRQNEIEISGIPPDKLCLAGLEILRHQRLIGLG